MLEADRVSINKAPWHVHGVHGGKRTVLMCVECAVVRPVDTACGSGKTKSCARALSAHDTGSAKAADPAARAGQGPHCERRLHPVWGTSSGGGVHVSPHSCTPGDTRHIRGWRDFSRFERSPGGRAPLFSKFGPPVERRPLCDVKSEDHFVNRRHLARTLAH